MAIAFGNASRRERRMGNKLKGNNKIIMDDNKQKKSSKLSKVKTKIVQVYIIHLSDPSDKT